MTIQSLYAEVLQEVTTTANRMKDTTIETEKKQLANMQSTFDTIAKNAKAYSTFLIQAAEGYEAAERGGTQKVQEQGKVLRFFESLKQSIIPSGATFTFRWGTDKKEVVKYA